MTNDQNLSGKFIALAALGLSIGLSGCSDDDDEVAAPTSNFKAFSETLFLSLDDFNCEVCHRTGGAAGNDPISDTDPVVAYNAIITPDFVSLDDVESSRVGSFLQTSLHNCGNQAECDATAQVFYDDITAWVARVDARFAAGVTPIADQNAFENNLLTPLNTTCGGAGCHSDAGVGDLAFIDTNDVLSTYNFIIEGAYVDLDDPASSGLVTRLTEDQHICSGTTDCETKATTLSNAITAWNNAVSPQ